MSSNSSIIDWLAILGISNLLVTEEILSGNTIHSILIKTVDTYKNDFLTPASAVNKINNWNNLIKFLQKINIKVSLDDKKQILRGNQLLVYNILSEIKTHVQGNKKQPEIDINKIDHRSEPKNSKSLLQLFILVIIKNLGLNSKQSVALLSNDSKYLAHIMAKGFKQQSQPVLDLLHDFQGLLPQIHEFCVNKQNQTFFLRSIKPGLISKFKQISELSLQILLYFSLSTQSPFQILKNQLMPTLILQYRRHPIFLGPICHLIIKLSKYTKLLLTILTNNMNQKELLIFCYEILSIAQQSGQLKQFYALAKVQQIVTVAVDSLSESGNFSIALLILVKMLETNYQLVSMDQKSLANIIHNLQHLAINKTQHIAAFTNGVFTLLNIFGSKKNAIAPAFFKLCVQKFKLAINQEESISYAYNLLSILQEFPSIPNTLIVDAVVQRYQNYKEVVNDLDISLLIRIAFGTKPNTQEQENDYEAEDARIPDEKTALKIYNLLSKLFFESITNGISIADTIIFIVRTHSSSQMISDLNLKMMKVALAIHYANIRKLNMSKSIIEGTIKLDETNAFAKRKNIDIEYLLKEFLNLKNQNFNRNIEPLICYSYIQSESKNKKEAEGLAKILSILGSVPSLLRKYEQQVRMLHQDKRTKKKTYPPLEQQQSKLNSVSSDLINKKKLNPGENYSLFLSKISKITNDAQKGLQKYHKGFQDKKKKIQIDEMKKIEEEEKKQQLQKKYTLKVLEKGVRIDPKMDSLHNYLYDFNLKQNEMKKQQFYDLTSLHIFNPDQEEVNDLEALKYQMKKYNKILKIYYSNYGGKLRPNSINLFDQLAEKQSLMQVANVWKLFKDYELDEFMTVRQAQYLIQKINARQRKSYCDTGLLDFQAFEDFIVQASLTMFSRAPKNLSGHSISQMVEETFYQFKMLAGQNKVDIRLFDDQMTYVQQDQSVAKLNLELKSNPDYIVPEGYKRVIQKKIEYFHAISLDAFSQTYTDVLDILDEVIYQKFDFHILEPFSQLTTNVYAKSLLSKKKQQSNEEFKEKYFSLNVKKQLFKYTSEERVVARQAAFCLSQIVDAVQHGKKMVPKNKVVYRQLQQEKRRLLQETSKKRQKRDQQLKKIIEKNKQQKLQKTSTLTQSKLKQDKKSQEEKKKKQKYQQQLKKKVQQYQQKKQEEKKKEEEDKIKEKQKQQQVFERKRQELAKVAKEIQQKKQSEKKAIEENQKKESLLKDKSKKNLKIRTSPKPLKKTDNQKTNQKTNQKIDLKTKQKENKV